MDINFLYREDWDRGHLPHLGNWVPAAQRTGVIFHHTVAVDPDETPNVWEDLDEIREFMQRLQLIDPPRLGADVPYNFVAFLRADGSLTLAHGRGWWRSGAHSGGEVSVRGLNRTAFGVAFAGNFHVGLGNLDAAPLAIEKALVELGVLFSGWRRRLFHNLGNHRPPSGCAAWGHRDIKPTECPGDAIYGLLWRFKLEGP